MKQMTLINYLRSPRYIRQKNINWLHFFKVFIGYFLITMILIGITYFLKDFLPVKHKMPSRNLKLMLHAILWAPIMEEIWFRLLLKPTQKNLQLFIVLSSLGLVYTFYRGAIVTGTSILIAVMIAGYVFHVRERVGVRLIRKYFKNFPLIYYFIAVSFGLVHLMNFSFGDLKLWMYFLLPILTLSQLYAGLVFGYIRMRYGLVYSILFHALNNLIPFIPFIFNSIK